ncbi:hypothetical protein [Actinacidiphila sp. bgisy160]|uniref:hypothetical protein n=1 Tax=Actinacidiphila sp. bgisy160 TaxID=3413796 RepID=UPI003D7316C7
MIPAIGAGPRLTADAVGRARVAAAVDEALCSAGLKVTGHGADPGLRAAIREAARGFFRLPAPRTRGQRPA